MGTAVISSSKIWVPHITGCHLVELALRIKPVLRFARRGRDLVLSPQGSLYYIKPVALQKKTYLRKPEPDCLAIGLKELCILKTYHAYLHPNSFSPSLAEILAAIPEKYQGQVVAFEIIDFPQTLESMRMEPEAFAAGYHVATTRLYRR